MENKKGVYQNTPVAQPNETPQQESSQKHYHQHNVPPQHLRLLQYGLKLPPHQHNAHYNQPGNYHLHQHPQQIQYQQVHRHQQPSPQQVHVSANPTYGHQHQSKSPSNVPNQPLFQSTQPPPLHPHNQMTQNSPQIWVPHQRPVHYHHQLQNKNEIQKQTNITNQQQQNKTKEKEVLEKKKSSGCMSQLRSPSAKRPLEAPVTKQGWLHKQGSEGLMLWKKRWFVLSEYCLFYYKGPEEEKLLGSILLPSYKVSACGPEDKVNRKFAFKCEHANMRTYILAVDSQEAMMTWIHVLNLACMLQTNVESDQSGPSVPSSYNQSTENSDSGFHQQLSNQNYKSTPVHTHSSSNTTDLSNASQQDFSQYNQPLYANAPPKPRRLNDGGYSSPSPDVLDRNPNPPSQLYIQHAQRAVPKSPVSIYGMSQSPEYMHHRPKPHEYLYTTAREIHNLPHNVERRTPDTYGRSKMNSMKARQATDYEDVYSDYAMYKRPLSPVSYSHIKKSTPNPTVNPVYRAYTPVNMLGPKEFTPCGPSNIRKSPSTIVRPHSADFLEYEVNHRQQNPAIKQQPRPKSSLDINRNTNDSDNYFYSEERYAEKMRKSAQYLPRMPRYTPTQNEVPLQVNNKTLPARYIENEGRYPLMRSNTQPVNFNNPHLSETPRNPQPVRSRSVLSEGSLSKELDMNLRSSPHERMERDIRSPASMHRPDMQTYNEDIRNREYDQFTRSASARLAQPSPHERIYDGTHIPREGDRKREESMKRLLEWKQRMLQSPLNRKVQGNRIYMTRDYYCKNHENIYQPKSNIASHPDGRRSVNNLPQYNSYSSDDEENEDRSKESVHAQAGRTLDTFPNNSESLTPAQSTSITVSNTSEEFDKPSTLPDPNMHENENKHKTNPSTLEDKPEGSDIACDNTTFSKPHFNKESSIMAHVSSLRSEHSDKFEQTPVITEIRSNGALVKSILAEFEKKYENNSEAQPDDHSKPGSPTTDVDTIIEENYMQMTPRKNILGPRSSNNSDNTVIFNEPEENPYVEMNQSMNVSLLANSTSISLCEQQQYEIVCFGENKIEPVYMELRDPEKQPGNSKNKELPDILMSQKSRHSNNFRINKSDSSDADDEASKDLDSLDTPSHPRFSLSDTFRPASYYLGASQTVPELQDSSDSELVSPPPIPTSPPPLEDLDITDDCLSSTQELSSIEQNKKERPYMFSPQPNRNSDQFFNSTMKLNNKFRGSTYSLDNKKSYVSPNCFKDPDTSSMGSVSTDIDRRFSSRLSHNSDSDIEIRTHSRNTDYDRMMKRRPVSEEFCDELESMNGNLNETADDVDLDKYLKDLQINNITLFSQDGSTNLGHIENKIQESHHDYENLYITGYQQTEVVSAPQADSSQRNLTNDTKNHSTLSDDFLNKTVRPESSASTCAELSALQTSNCSTPSIIRISSSMSAQEISTLPSYFSDKRDKSNNSSFSSQPAPYYYSDLSMNVSHIGSSQSILTLNNQRGAMHGGKKDITHIINPIKGDICIRNSVGPQYKKPVDNTFKLAAEARSVSVDFLNLTDKSGNIDKKNIYESDTLKRMKISDSQNMQSDPEIRNIYPGRKDDKFESNSSLVDTASVRRSHSLEGLLENVLSESTETQSNQDSSTVVEVSVESRDSNMASEGSFLWEEDTIWHERLRSASQRHTKSMDDLESIGESIKKIQKKSPRGITRGVTYVNDNLYNMPLQDKQQKELENREKIEYKTDVKRDGSFILDREKLRQWDLLSSAPSDDQLSTVTVTGCQTPRGSHMVVETGEGSVTPENTNTQEAASGSITINTRDTFPRAISGKRGWHQNSGPQVYQSRSTSNLCRGHDGEDISPQPAYYMQKGPSHPDINSETGHRKAQLHLMDQAKRIENLQKLEQIKQHLIELEKQYEKGKPLVNLVDNMVKLGSLYRTPNDRNNLNSYIRDRLEFNQQIQERRLLAEEKRDWNRLNPNHLQLQDKVQQLYQLDRLIHEESGTLQTLQQDKEDIERALGGLRMRLNKGFNDPSEVEQARKQQIILENELSRVHLMLAQNSKKLEETVAGNARLEQELLVLKQKLQISRQQRSSPQFSNAGDSLPCVVGTSAMLESDLQKVQQKVGDLQKQRQELSMQVRQLTDRSSSLQQQPKLSPLSQNNQSLGNKKKINTLWRETDLDTMNIVDHGDSWDNSSSSTVTTPLYINTDVKQNESDLYNRTMKSSDSTSDDTVQNLMPHEKQEIKTVRIVKRESERRQRDREKTTTTGKWDPLMEEDDSSQNSSILFRPTPVQKIPSSTSIVSQSFETDKASSSGILSRQSSLSSPTLPQVNYNSRTASSTDGSSEKSPELSPVFKSEAARQIITEVSIQDKPKQPNRRAVPKEKRRHYTAPNNNLIMKSLNQLPTDDNSFDKMILNSRRARDDLDMERALRQRIDAPDVVRSTLSNKELKYNENTIDNILGMPNKINIPERYIPEQLPQLSAEEQEYRLRKVESIKKMLSDTTIISASAAADDNSEKTPNSITNKATSKMIEEKKQREHLLQLNQILAKQVMEMSKIVAVNALANLPVQQQTSTEEEDSSPVTPLPIYQQRDNFYS